MISEVTLSPEEQISENHTRDIVFVHYAGGQHSIYGQSSGIKDFVSHEPLGFKATNKDSLAT